MAELRNIDVVPTGLQNMHQVIVLQVRAKKWLQGTGLSSNAGLVLIQWSGSNECQRPEIHPKILGLSTLYSFGAPAHSILSTCTARWDQAFSGCLVATKTEFIAR